jgi:hypothetical protein
MLAPYIGVTGFMKKTEVSAALETLDRLPNASTHKLMVGVLASSKTLAGRSNKWPNRYPDVQDIAALFPLHRRTVNLIHYATDDRRALADQLEMLVHLGGKRLDGFQLNIRWPEPATIVVPPDLRIVLQLGRGALEESGNDPEFVAKCLDAYGGVITDVLVDASGGRGIPIDPGAAQAYVRAIGARHPRLGIGVAGGLSSQTVGLLRPLAGLFPNLSVDAEGRLRTAEDHLDIGAMKTYIAVANALLG